MSSFKAQIKQFAFIWPPPVVPPHLCVFMSLRREYQLKPGFLVPTELHCPFGVSFLTRKSL